MVALPKSIPSYSSLSNTYRILKNSEEVWAVLPSDYWIVSGHTCTLDLVIREDNLCIAE